MPKPLSCPHGHRWEPADDAAAATADGMVACPVCGAAVDRGPLGSPPESAAEAPTVAPASDPGGPMPSETETLPPAPVASGGAEYPPVADANPPHPAVPGYEVVRELGRGGMGVVYQARQTKLDRLVALKVLPPQWTGDAAFAARFSREARALARLNHPHIITIHDFGQEAGQSYFIMEYVDGTSLRQRLRTGRLEPREAVRIGMQVCDALQYAHDHGVVHRDVKPENILLDSRGRVKIADFGIAKLLARQAADHTLTGPMQVMGTFRYMAPEQLENPLEVDHRADVYSLGVVAYEMLTGVTPTGRFVPPSQTAANVDGRLDEVVLRALEPTPERRYQQVKDFQAALESIASLAPQRSDASDPTAVEADARHRMDDLSPPATRPVLVWLLAALAVVIWPIGLALALPVGIWFWRVRRQPNGKAALGRELLRAESVLRSGCRRYLRPIFGTTTGWATITCLLGGLVTFQPFLPLLQLEVWPYGASDPIARFFAYQFLPGLVAGGVFVGLFLLLFVLDAFETVRWWRACLIFVGGLAVLGSMGIAVGANHLAWRNDSFSGTNYEFEMADKRFTVTYHDPGRFTVLGVTTVVPVPPGREIVPEFAAGPPVYGIIGLGAFLALLGTIQLRGMLQRRRREPGSSGRLQAGV